MNERKGFRVLQGQRQLFIDDHGIAQISGLRRTMHQPAKKGAVIRSSNPSQRMHVRMAPTWDPEERIFKLWVSGIDESYRLSTDGLHWTSGSKPDMAVTMVVRHASEKDLNQRCKAALLNAGFAISPDGLKWTKLKVPAVPSSDEGNFSFSEQDGLFIHTVKRTGPFGRSVAIATSSDFENW